MKKSSKYYIIDRKDFRKKPVTNHDHTWRYEMRHLMSPLDLSTEELEKILDLASDIETGS